MPAYRVIEKLGEGGMGVVYRAVQTSLEREVALKLLQDTRSENQGFVARFHREVEASARIVHPNVVKILDFGEIQGKPFYAMEYLVQPTLQQLLADVGKLAIPRAIAILQQLLDALSAIHRAGMVHRDLKPSNIMIGERDHVTVMDFGLVKFAPDRSVLTKTGMIVGTPSYLAPETIRGEHVDGRADLFPTGAILHEALTGARTFTAPSLPALLQAIAVEPHRPVRALRPDCPAALSDVVDRLLAKRPDDRFASAAEALEAVERFAEARLARAAMDATAPDAIPVSSVPARVIESTIDGGLAVLENVPAAPRAQPPGPPKRRTTGRTPVVARVTATVAVVPPPESTRRRMLAGAALAALALACAAVALRPAPAPSAPPSATVTAPVPPSDPAPAPGPALVQAIQALDPGSQIDAIHRDLRRIRADLRLADPPRPEMRALRDAWARQLSERSARAGLPAALSAFVGGKGAGFAGAAPTPASRRDCAAALNRLLDLRIYCDHFRIPLALDPALALRGYGRLARSRLTNPAGLCLRFKRSDSNTDVRVPPTMTPGLTVIDVPRTEKFSLAGAASNDLMDFGTENNQNRLDYVHPGPLPMPAPADLTEIEVVVALEGLSANNRLTVLASPDGRSFAPIAFFRADAYSEGEVVHAVESGLLTGPQVHLKIELTILPSMRSSGEYVNVTKLELRYPSGSASPRPR
jgi:hypothetical protein